MTQLTEMQKANVGSALVELYKLDLTRFAEGILYFTPATVGGASSISFGSQVYAALPITIDGLSVSADGAPPRPTLKFSNISKFAQPYLTDYNDIIGARITRILTLEKFLDSGASPDSTQIISTATFIIQQLIKLNKIEIEFVLSSLIDSPNFKLPRGIVLRSEFPGSGLFRKA